MNRFNTEIRTLFCLMFLANSHVVEAATINAASGSFIDVSNAISKASYRDTVQIPAGTWVWTNTGLSFSGITIAGAGTNSTYIMDNLPNGNGNYEGFLYVVPVPNALSRITGITFEDGGNLIPSFKGKILFDGRAATSATAWRLDHCRFVGLNGDNIYAYGFPVSVIDHCTFILGGSNTLGVTTGTAIVQYGITTIPNDPFGDYSWATPATYGTSNTLYVEDCYFTNAVYGSSSCAVYDAYAGARSVFRYNTVWNSFWANHGNDTSQRYRGTRQFEIYGNTFTDNEGFVYPLDFRSGTGVIFSNTCSGYSQFNGAENYRSVEPNYFGGVNGFNTWDSNNPTLYATGIVNGTTTQILFANNANWTPNQWAGYTVVDTNTAYYNQLHGGNNMSYCLIQANTTNELILTAQKDFPFVVSNGDYFQIYCTSNELDKIGNGSGDLIQDVGNWPNSYTINTVTGTNSWPHQVLEPLYSWGNILNGSPANFGSGYANIRQNCDYYINTIKPGYTPLVYPHPLVSGGSVSAQQTLSPPSNVQAH